MVLENACNVIFAQRPRDLPSFLLREGDATVVFVNADPAINVACICSKTVSPKRYHGIHCAKLPCVSISIGFPKALHVFPWIPCVCAAAITSGRALWISE